MSNYDSPREFDSDESVLNLGMVKSPEFSSHDYDRIAHLTWYTHSVDHNKLDPDADETCVYDHTQLDQPVRRFEWSEERERLMANVGEGADCRTVPVTETGVLSPYDKWDRDPMPEDLWETCVSNISAYLPQIEGIEVENYFPGRLQKTVDQLRSLPEWQSRPDELLMYAVDEHAEIVDKEGVTHYLSPSEREPAWMEDAPSRARPKTEIHD